MSKAACMDSGERSGFCQFGVWFFLPVESARLSVSLAPPGVIKNATKIEFY
jgi:hypothetical protein